MRWDTTATQEPQAKVDGRGAAPMGVLTAYTSEREEGYPVDWWDERTGEHIKPPAPVVGSGKAWAKAQAAAMFVRTEGVA